MRADPNVAYTVEEFLADNVALRAAASDASSTRPLRPVRGPRSGTDHGFQARSVKEKAYFTAKYGHAAAGGRMARHAFVTDLTDEFDAELRAAGLVTSDGGRVGTAKSWLAFALGLLIPPDRENRQVREAIARSVREYCARHEAAEARRKAAVPSQGLLVAGDAGRHEFGPPDPRSFEFLGEAEFADLDEGVRATLRFLSRRLDQTTELATRGFYAALLRDVVREIRIGMMTAFVGGAFEARLSPLVPEVQPTLPFTTHEGRMLVLALDAAVGLGRPSSLAASAARNVVIARVLGGQRTRG